MGIADRILNPRKKTPRYVHIVKRGDRYNALWYDEKTGENISTVASDFLTAEQAVESAEKQGFVVTPKPVSQFSYRTR